MAVDAERLARIEAAVPSDPWKRALATALVDVQRALGSATDNDRAPMFSEASELLTRDFPLAVWAIAGLLTRRGIGMVAGEPKTAKTWLALELAIAIATGTKACGEFFAEHGIAAYFFAEDLDKQVRNRLRALLAGAGRALPVGRLHVCPRGKFLDITKDEDLAWIVASARQLGPIDLLVLDPLRDVHSAEENESDGMSKVMKRLRVLGELIGCTVLVVHHTAKASADSAKRRPGQRMRGSGAIHGSTDSGIYLSDSESESPNVLRNVVESEIKGAGGAGRFNLELSITDDDNAEATCATWAMSRDVAKVTKKAIADSLDDNAVWFFVRDLAMQGVHLSRRAIRDHEGRPIGEKRTVAALDRLIDDQKRLVLRGKVVHLPDPPPTRGDSP